MECSDRVFHELRAMPVLFNQCESILIQRHRPFSERVRGGLRGSLNLNQEAFGARDDIMSILASWSSLVVDERQPTAKPERSVKAMTGFLISHLDWLVEHPAAPDLVAEIHEVFTAAEHAVNPDASVPVNLGPCGQQGCDGAARVTAKGHTPLEYQVRCGFSRERRSLARVTGSTPSSNPSNVCPAMNPGALRGSGSSTAGPLLTTQMAAMVAGVPDATIRKWASRGKLTRYGQAAQAHYDLREIIAIVANRESK